ncbi:hypothetical protein Rcae01_04277 [Novipirellula caenicola]|uniref:Uncharacterized protein n=1 Tax=Novipirellula caenicola TaxID=1536901 RepID=A0ABP9VYY6_9BACT
MKTALGWESFGGATKPQFLAVFDSSSVGRHGNRKDEGFGSSAGPNAICFRPNRVIFIAERYPREMSSAHRILNRLSGVISKRGCRLQWRQSLPNLYFRLKWQDGYCRYQLQLSAFCSAFYTHAFTTAGQV